MNSNKIGKDLYHVRVDFANKWGITSVTEKEKYLRELKLYLLRNFPECSWIVTDAEVSIEKLPPDEVLELPEVDELYNHQQLMLDNMKADGNTIIETSRQSGSTHVLLEYIKHILNNNEGYLIRYMGPPRRTDALHMLREELNPISVSQTSSTLTFSKIGTDKPNKIHVLPPSIHDVDHRDIRGHSYNGIVDIYDNNRITGFTGSRFWQRLRSSYDICPFAVRGGNFKSVLIRTGQPDSAYRKILLTGKFRDVYFKNRLKLDYSEIALLNEEQGSYSLNALPHMFDSQHYSRLKSQLGEKDFNREHRLHLELGERYTNSLVR